MVSENSKTPSIAESEGLYSAHAVTVCCSDGVQEFRVGGLVSSTFWLRVYHRKEGGKIWHMQASSQKAVPTAQGL